MTVPHSMPLAADPTRDDRKTAAVAGETERCPALRRRSDGTVEIGSFAAARQVLRSGATRQAGFRAEDMMRFSTAGIVPILYQEGEAHHRQRAATARFFAPKVVTTRYRELTESLADRLITEFRAKRSGNLDDLSLELAVTVAAEIVGLTESDPRALARRVDRFFAEGETGGLRGAIHEVKTRVWLLSFYLRDVRPAIRARRKAPREDVISHLVGQGYADHQILTECITYAAAGMATTREFIVVAAWHLFDRPELRDRFLAAEESGKIAILEEILRLEPVVGTLFRRTREDLPLTVEGAAETIPAGTKVALNIRSTNTDSAVVGACPFSLDPDRQFSGSKAGGEALAFGDGAHRCPGAPLAMLESAIFLDRLMRVPGLKLERSPAIGWGPTVAGYELRGARLTAEG